MANEFRFSEKLRKKKKRGKAYFSEEGSMQKPFWIQVTSMSSKANMPLIAFNSLIGDTFCLLRMTRQRQLAINLNNAFYKFDVLFKKNGP